MRFHSTRQGTGPGVTASEAIWRGLAEDGGLYVPEQVPVIGLSAFDGCDSDAAVAARVPAPFFSGDPLEAHLADICREALNFPMPVVPLPGDPAPAVLELFHGPTCAFKDVGARFLAGCLARLQQRSGRTTTILVATSGDTGGAVAAAFHGDHETLLAGEIHGGRYVISACAADHQIRSPVEPGVPDGTGGVEASVAGAQQFAGDTGFQGVNQARGDRAEFLHVPHPGWGKSF